MKRMKWLTVLTIVSMLAFLFAGCQTASNTSASGKSEKVLKLAHFFDPANKKDAYSVTLSEIIAQFEKETGIKVEVETLPWDQIDSKLVITNTAGDPPDLSWASSQKMASLVNAGALRPLNDFEKNWDNKPDFSELESKATTSALDGKKYMYLASIHSRLLWYNKDLVPNPPKTWDELVSTAKKVTNKEKGIYGFGFWGAKHYGSVEVTLAPFIWSAGGKISNSDGSAAFNTPQVAEAIKFLSDAVHVYGISPQSAFTADFSELDNAFKAGNIAMIINGSYAINSYLKETDLGRAGKIGAVPIPGKNGPAPNFANGWALAIPSKSKHPDLAWQFIKFFERPDIQIKHSVVEGGLPTSQTAWNDKAFQTPIFQAIFDNLNKNGRPMDPLVYYQEGLEAVNLAALGYFLDPSADLKKLLDDQANAFNGKYYKK